LRKSWNKIKYSGIESVSGKSIFNSQRKNVYFSNTRILSVAIQVDDGKNFRNGGGLEAEDILSW